MIPFAKYTISGPPVIKKNSRQIQKNFRTGKPFIGKNDRLKNAEKHAVMELISQRNARGASSISSFVNAKFSFYLPTKRLPDLSNLYQLGEDAMQKAGILEDDKLIAGHDGSRRYYDKENPRTEIELSDIL